MQNSSYFQRRAHRHGWLTARVLGTGIDFERTRINIKLMDTIRDGHVIDIEEILKQGADVNHIGMNGHTPLIEALRLRTDEEIYKVLLRHGADVQAVYHGRNSCLHVAVDAHQIRKVKELLKYGAKVDFCNFKNETAMHLAVSAPGNEEIVQELLAHKANIQIADWRRRTPLDIAMRMDKCSYAELLVKYALIPNFCSDSSKPFNLNAYTHLRNYVTAARYFEECTSEFVKMKTTKVNGRFSLYDFVITKNTNIPLFSENEDTLIATQEEKLIANYPIYHDIILLKVKYALERGKLLTKLNTVYIRSGNYFGVVKSSGEKVALNYDCIALITKNLSNDDLCNLMLAAYDFNLNISESLFLIRKQIQDLAQKAHSR